MAGLCKGGNEPSFFLEANYLYNLYILTGYFKRPFTTFDNDRGDQQVHFLIVTPKPRNFTKQDFTIYGSYILTYSNCKMENLQDLWHIEMFYILFLKKIIQ